MCVYKLGALRMVDLTKELNPKSESRRCHLYRFNTGGPIPDYHTIMDLTSHLGTHCECPYHHDDDWACVASLPLTSFVGRAVYLDLKETVAPCTHITAADLDWMAAGKVRAEDVIASDRYAWELTKLLINEAVQVANSIGLEFVAAEVVEKVRMISVNKEICYSNCQ